MLKACGPRKREEIDANRAFFSTSPKYISAGPSKVRMATSALNLGPSPYVGHPNPHIKQQWEQQWEQGINSALQPKRAVRVSRFCFRTGFRACNQRSTTPSPRDSNPIGTAAGNLGDGAGAVVFSSCRMQQIITLHQIILVQGPLAQQILHPFNKL